MTFKDFNFDPQLLEGLTSMGFSKPTPIQEQAIPVILEGKDLIACAQTGTGKTAAYVLPILHKIIHSSNKHLNTLVLAPTRELAIQVDQQVEGFSYFIDVNSIAIYGGNDGNAWVQQKRALNEGANIVIATPGRLIALLQSGDVKFDQLQHLVLDEADRMLDMGFLDDLLRIISYLPQVRQTILFSATMPPKIRTLANKILQDPEQVNIAISKPAEGILQQAYVLYDNQKMPLLRQILDDEQYSSIIIFASSKESVKNLERELRRAKLSAKGFSSDLDQSERESIMREFRSRQLRILIGTDILSRGIDIDGINLVINYDAPPDPEDYIHRIGRTARASTTGTAITFINEKDQSKFSHVENLIGKEVTKLALPADLGPGPEYQPHVKHRKPPRYSKDRPQNQKPGHAGSNNNASNQANNKGNNSNKRKFWRGKRNTGSSNDNG
ncbi:MAG TPA: DEAD/DEAH box helicase [Cytophagales bacterium]|nr:DEAD/DEAH box helicase [Cytophagales bacterium]